MVRLVRKMLWALIKKCKIIFLAMAFVSALGVVMGTGFLSTYVNFKENANAFIRDYGYPDVTLNLAHPTSKIEIENALKDLPYRFASRIEYSFSAEVNNRPVTLDVKTISDDSF